jgi:hypothetical protein
VNNSDRTGATGPADTARPVGERIAGIAVLGWASAIAVTVQAALLVHAHAHLFADGAFYLYWLLLEQRPLDIDFARHFAHLATQYPAALAIELGATRVETLSRVLGVGLYGPTLAALACAAWIARAQPRYLIFPLATAAAVGANSSFFAVSEGHLLAALFWPLAFLLVLRRTWSAPTFVLAAVLAFPTLRSYESMVLLGPILALLAGWRARGAGGATRLAFLALAAYFAAGAALAAHEIAYPREPGNLASFVESLRFYRDHRGHWHRLGLMSLAGLALVAIALLTDAASRSWPVVLAAFALACGAAALAPLAQATSVAPLLHYRARVLNAYLPPLLAAVFLLVLRREPTARGWRYAFVAVAILAVSQAAWHALATREWSNYLALFRHEVAARRGLIAYRDSLLSHDSEDGRPVATMNWAWTMPTMSVLLAPGGDVRALVANERDQSWEPFDPADPEELPDLSRFGIRFDAYRAALAATSRASPAGTSE